jgi:hypothetical protein
VKLAAVPLEPPQHPTGASGHPTSSRILTIRFLEARFQRLDGTGRTAPIPVHGLPQGSPTAATCRIAAVVTRSRRRSRASRPRWTPIADDATPVLP